MLYQCYSNIVVIAVANMSRALPSNQLTGNVKHLVAGLVNVTEL